MQLLAALRQHLDLKLADLDPLLPIYEAMMARRAREHSALDRVALDSCWR